MGARILSWQAEVEEGKEEWHGDQQLEVDHGRLVLGILSGLALIEQLEVKRIRPALLA